MHIIDIVISTKATLLRRRISFIIKFIDHSNISYFFIIQIPFAFLLLELLSSMVFSTIDLFFAPKYILFQILISFQNVTEIEVTRYFLVSKNILLKWYCS